jgi:hypothetical protein
LELGDVVLKYIPQGQVFRANAAEGTRIAALAGSAAPAPAAEKPKGGMVPSLVAAAIGAIVVGGIVLGVLSGREKSSDPAHSRLPEGLIAVEVLLDQGELSTAGDQFKKLSSAEKSLAAYRALEIRWAQSVLSSASESHGDEKYRKLLDQVARRESLPPTMREQASKRLVSLSEGAIDLNALEEGEPQPDAEP